MVFIVIIIVVYCIGAAIAFGLADFSRKSCEDMEHELTELEKELRKKLDERGDNKNVHSDFKKY